MHKGNRKMGSATSVYPAESVRIDCITPVQSLIEERALQNSEDPAEPHGEQEHLQALRKGRSEIRNI